MNKPDSAGIVIPPPFLYLIPLAAGYALSRLYPVWFLPAALTGLLGWLCVVLWLVVAGSAILAFRRAGTSINPMVPAAFLVEAGPYRWTRNPMYVGLAFAYAGVALLTRSLWALVLLPVVLIVIQRTVIEREERYLGRRFGADYVGTPNGSGAGSNAYPIGGCASDPTVTSIRTSVATATVRYSGQPLRHASTSRPASSRLTPRSTNRTSM